VHYSEHPVQPCACNSLSMRTNDVGGLNTATVIWQKLALQLCSS
jgi:hypothetical protein